MSIELSTQTLTPSQGFGIIGGQNLNYAGLSVDAAGDVNGDGIADVIVASKGTAYVVYGKDSLTRSDVGLGSLSAADGFKISVAAANVPLTVKGIGDVNGDGFDDVAVGDPSANNIVGIDAGTIYVVFGSQTGPGGPVNVSTMTASQGISIYGPEAGGLVGSAVSKLGDLDNDGFDDVLIAAPMAIEQLGLAYVLSGAAITSATDGELNLSALTFSDTRVITGAAYGARFGYSVGDGGDVNGDGFVDLLIGMPGMTNGNGQGVGGAVLVTNTSGTTPGFSMGGVSTAGVFFEGNVAGDGLGRSVAIVSDINDDGIDDMVISTHTNDGNGTNSGITYVIYGSPVISSTETELGPLSPNTLPSSAGFVIAGGNQAMELGTSISSAGDFNGDGIGDLLIGAPGFNSSVGTAYIVFGKSGATRGLLELNAIGAEDGIQLIGRRGLDQAGYSVSGAGDVNGDGFDDLIVGAPYNSYDVNGAFGEYGSGYILGAAFVVYGFGSTPPTPPSFNTINGTADADTLTGTSGDDLIDGLASDDVLRGGDGNDSIVGGDGDDILYGDAGENTLAGGQGDDAYNIVNANDVIQEDVNGGTDRAYTEVTYTLAANVEDLVLLDGSAINGTGNALNNTIYGNTWANTISGGDGDDTILAYGGVDIVYGDAGNDVLDGGTGNDRLYGGEGDDVFLAGYGSATETISGGAGNDTYQISGTAVQSYAYNVNLESGNDQYGRVFSGIETIIGGNGDDTITGRDDTAERLNGGVGNDLIHGSAGDDTALGGDGNDTIYGDGGQDTLIGGQGSDVYYVDDANDVVQEAEDEGYDKVFTTVSYTLTDFVEELRLSAGYAINGTGSAQGNNMFGNELANILSGGDGGDAIFGDAGDDLINGDAGNDNLFGQAGNDQIYGGLDNDYMEGGDDNDDLFGDTGNDTLFGGAGNDLLSADVGNDSLRGESGDDSLYGDAGNDNLRGEEGNDYLNGGAGNDYLSDDYGQNTMVGGDGDDRFDVGSENTVVEENEGEGTDSVHATVSFTLGSNIEKLYATLNGTGNELDNVIFGGGLSNALQGMAGDDTSQAGAGKTPWMAATETTRWTQVTAMTLRPGATGMTVFPAAMAMTF